MPISDHIVPSDDEPAAPRGLILGEDGRVHVGEVAQKWTGTLMRTSCGAAPLRLIRSREGGWWTDDDRVCASCGPQTLVDVR